MSCSLSLPVIYPGLARLCSRQSFPRSTWLPNNPDYRTAEHLPLGSINPPNAASGYFR